MTVARATVVEIVGVAGTGKSTATRGFAAADPGVVVDEMLHTRVPGHWPAMLRGAWHSRRLLAAAVPRRLLTWDDAKFVLYAAGWDRRVRRTAAGVTPVLVLDQGPVFALARLATGAPRLAALPAHGPWRAAVVARWARALTAVVWLDAPDEVLRARIDGREQRHEVKGAAPERVVSFLAGYRSAFDGVIHELTSRSESPTVVRLDTSGTTPAEVVAQLRAVAGSTRRVGAGGRT